MTIRPFHVFALLTLGIAAACASVSPADSAAGEAVKADESVTASGPSPVP